MARNESGAWNRFLNFIGLVDDENNRDTYGEEYSGGGYGRRAAYTPARPQRPGSGRAAAPRPGTEGRASAPRDRYDTRPADRYDARPSGRYDARPAGRYDSPSSGRYDAQSSGRYDRRPSQGYDDYRAAQRRAESRFDGPGYAPRSTRQPSRYDPQSDERYSANAPQRANPPRMRVGPRSRTVMYSLHSLEDCCEVIDQLIANNTVVLTMDELDGHLLQRAVDTLSGAVFALHASIRKASDRTYLVAPMSVEVNEGFDSSRRF